MIAIHCTGHDVPLWQVFPIYREYKNRRLHLRWGSPPKEPQREYISPLATARRYLNILNNDPKVRTQADLAREEGVSRVRITQVMNLLKLAPNIQEHLLRLQDQELIRYFTEHRLRPLVQIKNPKHQLREFRKLMSQIEH